MSEMTKALSYVAAMLGGVIIGMAIQWCIERIDEHDERVRRDGGGDDDAGRDMPMRG